MEFKETEKCIGVFLSIEDTEGAIEGVPIESLDTKCHC